MFHTQLALSRADTRERKRERTRQAGLLYRYPTVSRIHFVIVEYIHYSRSDGELNEKKLLAKSRRAIESGHIQTHTQTHIIGIERERKKTFHKLNCKFENNRGDFYRFEMFQL